MAVKISSYDFGYLAGDLSVFPEAIDNYDTLYFAKNNSETKLVQSLVYGSDKIIVDSTQSFPDRGLIRINLTDKFAAVPEYIYYDEKTETTFQKLIRGFGGSRQQNWPINSPVIGGVFSEHHNALKDAVIQMQSTLGTETNPAVNSINSNIKTEELRFYSAQPIFRGYPRSGRLPLTVKFQNLSTSIATKFFWDFGDGGTSLERSPEHTYLVEGTFTVTCRIITSLGGQGYVSKTNYIRASNTIPLSFFYTTPLTGYSVQTASKLGIEATQFSFVDQSEGDIQERLWVFNDGSTENQTNPNVHYAYHYYSKPGTYTPNLLLTSINNVVNKIIASSPIKVL